jgi:hypothetical protein
VIVLALVIDVTLTCRSMRIEALVLPSTDVDDRHTVDSESVPPTAALVLPDADTGTIVAPTTVTLIAPVPAVFVTTTSLVIPTSKLNPNE